MLLLPLQVAIRLLIDGFNATMLRSSQPALHATSRHITETDAKEAARTHLKKDKKATITVDHGVEYLVTLQPQERYKFTFIAQPGDETFVV